MEIEVYLTSKHQAYNAIGLYTDKTFIVKKGSKIRLGFAGHIKGGKTAKRYREDPSVVDAQGNVLKDCAFGSSSTAAQFVTGCSTNGLEAWRVDKQTSLKSYLGA